MGVAHVGVGALRVLNFLVFTLATSARAILSPASVVLVVLAAATVLGGLWLADGLRRGAVLSLTMDVAHVLALLLLSRTVSPLDLVMNIALAIGVIWVLPRLQLEHDARKRAGR